MRFSWNILLLFVALLGLGACSGGDGGDGKDAAGGDAALESARDGAISAQEDADDEEAKKYAQKKYDEAVENLAKADEMREDPEANPSPIKSLYKKAQRNFEKATKAAKTNKKDAKLVERSKKKFEDEVAKRDEEKLPYKQLDADGWLLVEKKIEEAAAFVEEGELKNARRRYDSALSEFKTVVRTAQRQTQAKVKAETARSKMEQAKKEAEAAKALELAKDEMAYADQEAQRALERFTLGEYNMAESHYITAAGSYTQAKNSAAYASAITKEPQAKPEETDSLNGNPRVAYKEAPKREKTDDEEGDEEGGFIDDMTVVLSVLNGDPDFEDGMLTLTYGIGSGMELKKDLALVGAKSEEYLRFFGRMGVGTEGYCVAGNTGGMILFEPVFRDRVRIEVDYQAQLNLDNPAFEIIINASNTKNYISSWYGSDIRIKSGGNQQIASKCLHRDWTKHPNNWFDRKEVKTLIVQCDRKEDEKKGIVSVYHGGEEPCARLPTKRVSGRVGLYWRNAKWYATEIRISGRLDEEWLAEFVAKHGESVANAGNEGDEEEEEWKPEKKKPKTNGEDEDDDDFDF